MGSTEEASSVAWGVDASESTDTECVLFFLDDVDLVRMPLSSASEASKTVVVDSIGLASWSVEAKSADDVCDGKDEESRVSEASSVSSLEVEIEVALLSVSISEFGVANVTSVDVVEDSTCSADVELSYLSLKLSVLDAEISVMEFNDNGLDMLEESEFIFEAEAEAVEVLGFWDAVVNFDVFSSEEVIGSSSAYDVSEFGKLSEDVLIFGQFASCASLQKLMASPIRTGISTDLVAL